MASLWSLEERGQVQRHLFLYHVDDGWVDAVSSAIPLSTLKIRVTNRGEIANMYLLALLGLKISMLDFVTASCLNTLAIVRMASA